MKRVERSDLYFYQGTQLGMLLRGNENRTVFRYTNHPLAERVSGGKGDDSRMLATDDRGSVLELQTGCSVQSLCYSAYGYGVAESGLWSLLQFNGEHSDPLMGCYLLGNGHRVFSPVLMRFYSPDVKSPFSSGGTHSYAYCAGDPVNFVDPSGNVRVKPLVPTNSLRNLKQPTSRRAARRMAQSLNIDAINSQIDEQTMRSLAAHERAVARDSREPNDRLAHLAQAEQYEQQAIESAADRRRYASQAQNYFNSASVNQSQQENRIPSGTRPAAQPVRATPSQEVQDIRQ